MNPLRRLYRDGSTKPEVIAVTPEQFDALCDLVEQSAKSQATAAGLLEWWGNTHGDFDEEMPAHLFDGLRKISES